MQMEVEQIKKKIENSGIKKAWIASQIGCSPSQLSHFLSKQRDLPRNCKSRLDDYLKLLPSF